MHDFVAGVRQDLQVLGPLCNSPPSPRHLAAVNAIIRFGGEVHLDEEHEFRSETSVVKTNVVIGESWHGGDEGLQTLAGLDRIDALDLRSSAITNSAAEELQHLVRIRTISLYQPGMTDEGLWFLGDLPHLRNIRLSGPFTEASAKFLISTTAENVSFVNTQVARATALAIENALRKNRDRAQYMQKLAALDKLQQQVDLICDGFSPEEMRSFGSDREWSDAIRSIYGHAAEAIPLLYRASQRGSNPGRLRAIAMLITIGNRCVSLAGGIGGARAPSVDVAKDATETLADLKRMCVADGGITWTKQQRALIELGVLGVDLRTSLFLSSRQPGYEVMIGPAWTGKDRDLALLADIGPIRELYLYEPQVTKSGFRIVQSLPSLATLETNVLNLDAECLASLRGLTNLSSLRLPKLATPQAMSELVGVDSLTRLSVRAVSDESLQYIAKLPKLQHLEISMSPDFHGGGLRYFGGHTNLRTLALLDTGVIRQAISCLAQIPELVELSLYNVPLTDTGLQQLGKTIQLRKLSIQNCTITDEQVSHLLGLTNIEDLRLSDNGISNRGVALLAQLPRLRNVDLEGTFVTHDECSKLLLSLTQVDSALRRLATHSRHEADFSAPSDEYMATVKEITTMGACVSRGRTGARVTLFKNWSGRDGRGMRLLVKLGNVESIRTHVPLSVADARMLRGLPNLESIVLIDTLCSDDLAKQLQETLADVRIHQIHTHQ